MKTKTKTTSKSNSTTVQSSVTLPSAMYLIRLLRKQDGEGLREVCVRKDENFPNGEVTFFSGLGVSGQTLNAPGQCLVVRVADAAAHLTLDYVLDRPDALEFFVVKIDRIDDSGRLPDGDAKQKPAISPPAKNAATPISAVLPITLTGQIDSLGEVAVALGEWLGKPDSNQSIEGIVLSWPDKPAGLELSISAQLGLIGMLPHVGLNEYVGVKGLGAPFTGISLQLSGPQAEHYLFELEAVFGGWGKVSSGPCRETNLTGPTETEPIVALKLAVWRNVID